MDKNSPTLAVYWIQDRQEYEFLFYVHDHIMVANLPKLFLNNSVEAIKGTA